jgi:hypothetical protein
MNQYALDKYNNSFLSAMSVLSPPVGFATGHNQQAMQGIGTMAQLAGAYFGGAGGGGGQGLNLPGYGGYNVGTPPFVPTNDSILSQSGLSNAMRIS